MELGVVFPQTEVGAEPETIREYARAVEGLGYDHVLAYDHVLGVNPERPDWNGPYDYEDPFHEPLTLFSHMAGVTQDVDFVTGILILPQRQTALVAKQAAEVDVLSGGRLRLGVGLGWNEPEYVALGEDFTSRGRRVEEQIEVLRALWTRELVEYDGEFHTIPDAGIRPLPEQRPIPIWLGGTAEPVLRRVARLGDGWLPQFQPGPEAEEQLERLRGYARDAGRDPDDVGIHGRVSADVDERESWGDRLAAWDDLGAEYLAVNTMYQGLDPDEHVDVLRSFADAARDAGVL